MKLYIVNQFDRPNEIHLAARHPGTGLLRYVHPDLADRAEFHDMSDKEATPASDFGLVHKVRGGMLLAYLAYPSIAHYRNGDLRHWQGAEKFSFKLPEWTERARKETSHCTTDAQVTAASHL